MKVSRDSQTIQTHNAVSVGASGFSLNTTFIDCSGFYEINVTLFNDATTSSSANVWWSHDGVTLHAQDPSVAPISTSGKKAGNTKVKARYAKVELSNADTIAHTMSAWAYLTT